MTYIYRRIKENGKKFKLYLKWSPIDDFREADYVFLRWSCREGGAGSNGGGSLDKSDDYGGFSDSEGLYPKAPVSENG